MVFVYSCIRISVVWNVAKHRLEMHSTWPGERWAGAMPPVVPTPIFSVEPTSIATLPLRHAANRAALSASVMASWMNLTRSTGMLFATSSDPAG